MRREDLGKMLEQQMGQWVRDDSQYDSEEIDLRYQWAAEGFWNDVIDALAAEAEAEVSSARYKSGVAGWLRERKIGDDE